MPRPLDWPPPIPWCNLCLKKNTYLNYGHRGCPVLYASRDGQMGRWLQQSYGYTIFHHHVWWLTTGPGETYTHVAKMALGKGSKTPATNTNPLRGGALSVNFFCQIKKIIFLIHPTQRENLWKYFGPKLFRPKAYPCLPSFCELVLPLNLKCYPRYHVWR